jgi:hypothetical protein
LETLVAPDRARIYRADLRYLPADAPGIEAARTLTDDSPGALGKKCGRVPAQKVVCYELLDVEDGVGAFRPWTDMERAAFQVGIDEQPQRAAEPDALGPA